MNRVLLTSMVSLSLVAFGNEGALAVANGSSGGEASSQIQELNPPADMVGGKDRDVDMGAKPAPYTIPEDISLFKSNDDPAQETTIKKTLENAYMQNAQLDSARASLRSTDENVSQAVSQWRPSSSIRFSQRQNWEIASGRRPGPAPSPLNPNPPKTLARENSHAYDTAMIIEAEQNVFAGGGTYAQTQAAKERVFAGRSGLKNTEQQTLLAGVQAFLAVITNEAIAELRKSSENFLYRTWEQTQARYDVGEVTRTEVAAAESSYLGAKADRITAEGNVETARASYERTVGTPAGDLGKAEVLSALPDALTDVIDQALANNPAIHQAKHNVEAAEYDVNTRIAELLPTVDVSANIERSRNGGTGVFNANNQMRYQLLATARMPLYRQGISRSRIRQAHQEVARNKVDSVEARRQTVESATKAWEDLVSARSTVESLIEQVKAQKLAVEGVSEEALVGTKNVLDVLKQEQDLVSAQINLVQAEQSLVTASYQVLSAIGRLTAQDLHLDVEIYNPEEYYDEHSGAMFKFWKGQDYSYVKDKHEDDN